ncbi:MAG: hypothetical protein ACC682_09895 [Gemmatimonadota bacterium]
MIGAVAAFYVALFAALIWPIYPAFATIEPRVLSMPFSLAYVVGALILSFVVLLWLYLREHTGEGDPQVGEGDPQVGEGEPQDGGESTGRHG